MTEPLVFLNRKLVPASQRIWRFSTRVSSWVPLSPRMTRIVSATSQFRLEDHVDRLFRSLNIRAHGHPG